MHNKRMQPTANTRFTFHCFLLGAPADACRWKRKIKNDNQVIFVNRIHVKILRFLNEEYNCSNSGRHFWLINLNCLGDWNIRFFNSIHEYTSPTMGNHLPCCPMLSIYLYKSCKNSIQVKSNGSSKQITSRNSFPC